MERYATPICCIICNIGTNNAKENPYAKHPSFFFPSHILAFSSSREGGAHVTKKIPRGVEHAVRGYCEDYPRRREEIQKGVLPAEVIGHYMVINAKIDRAIASCCDESFCEEIREDIASSTGYDHSRISFLSFGSYKARKRACKLAIAKELHLL